MSTESSAEKAAVNGIRTALGIGGVLAVIAGILILAWPLKTAAVLTFIFALYALVAGLVYFGLGIFSKGRGGWSRVGHILLGVLIVIAAVVALFNLQETTLWLAVFVGVFIGILWIIEGIVSLTSLGGSSSKGWTVFFAIVSILAGVVLLFSPLYIAVLWWLLAIALIVFGVVSIVRAFRFTADAV